jgi:hypothetical protein
VSAATTLAQDALVTAAERTGSERMRLKMEGLVGQAHANGKAEGRRECARELDAVVCEATLPGSTTLALAGLVLRWKGGLPAATVEARIRKGWPAAARLAGLPPETTPAEAAMAEAGDP